MVAAVPILQPGAFTEDPALGNDDGINSLIFRGGDESGGTAATEDKNPAFRLFTADVSTYDINWLCTVGIIPACECPAAGTALSGTCGGVFETEEHMVVATITGEGDVRNLSAGVGTAAMGGTVIIGVSGGYDMAQGSGGVMTVLSAQASYDIGGLATGTQNVEGIALSGWLRQAAEQVIEEITTGLMLYDDWGNADPTDDEIRQIIFRLLFQRGMP